MNVEHRLEIQDLVHHYAYYVDTFKSEEWAALFAPDAILDESEFEKGKYVGREAIFAYGEVIKERIAHIVHLMTNHLIWEMQNDTARGTCFAIVESMTKAGARARFQVMYEDEYRRLDGRWVIQTRILRKTFPPEVMSS